MSSIDRWKSLYYGNDERLNFIDKIRLIITKPGEFFERVGEESIKECIIFFITLIIIGIIVDLLDAGSTFLTGFPAIIVQLLFMAVPIGIFHFFVKLFRGSGNISDTSKVTIYSYTILFLFLMLMSILNISGLSIQPRMPDVYATTLTEIQRNDIIKSYTAGLINLGLIGFIFITWFFYLLVSGLSRYHNLTRKRTILALIIPAALFAYVMIYPLLSQLMSMTMA